MGRHLFRRKTLTTPSQPCGAMARVLAVLLLLSCTTAAGASAFQALEIVPAEDAPSSPASETRTLPFFPDLSPPELYHLPVPEDELIREHLEYFSGKGKEWLDRALERSLIYRDFIQRQLFEHGAPPELYYLPVVESAFRNSATSRTGAAGLWQFMANSVSGYDMRITAYLDERRDFWKSTEGALRKLKDNYRVLGDWNLAMAAYNAGLGRVLGVVRRTGIRDFWELARKKLLPRETRGYVPQFMAVVKLMTRRPFGSFSWTWDDSPDWRRVAIDRTVDLRLLAEAAGVPFTELQAANRELLYPITPAQTKTYFLKVPAAWESKIRTALDDPDLKLIRFYFYAIKQGDTLSEISAHYGVSQDGLERYNPGLRPRFLKIGQTLVIPALKVVGPFLKNHAAGSSSELPQTFGNYTVSAGDSLWSIARRHGTTVEALAKANGIAVQATLRLGQKLQVPDEIGEVRP